MRSNPVGGLELSLSLCRYAMVASPAATPSETQVRALGGGSRGGWTLPRLFAKRFAVRGGIFVNGWEIARLDSEECTHISSSYICLSEE